MSTREASSDPPMTRPQPAPQRRSRRALFFAFAVVVVPLCAVLLSVPASSIPASIRAFLRSILPSRTLFRSFSPRATILNPGRTPCVLWMAPFISGSGYGSEAWSYIAAINANTSANPHPPFRLRIEHHGDLESLEFWQGLPEETRRLGFALHATPCEPRDAVVVCHSEPGAWDPPLFETLPCPPPGFGQGKARFVIGRTMFETDRVNPEHAARCNRMDAVWVPTAFHVDSFARSGVRREKLVKVVQPIDVRFFDPDAHAPLTLPCRRPVLGSSVCGDSHFIFLSVFKWEHRKGWDVLLRAYLSEFSATDNVALYLLTNAYHTDTDFRKKIKRFLANSSMDRPEGGWSPVFVLDAHIPQSDLPALYKAAGAFVLPTRGEGWGRPIVEAMAMALPVIATDWSGPTEYLTHENGYPVPVETMTEVEEGPFKGHLWAEPSIEGLRKLMRRVVEEPEEAMQKGRKARDDMVNRYSPEVVGGIVVAEILKILEKDRQP